MKMVAMEQESDDQGSVWRDVRAEIKSARGKPALVRLPPNKTVKNLRSVLSMWRETQHTRWSIKPDNFGMVTVSKAGEFLPSFDTSALKTTKSVERVKHATETTIERVTETSVSVPFTAVPTERYDPLALIPEDPPEAKEFLDSMVRVWADPTVSDYEADRINEHCSDLAGKIWNHRNARRRIAEIITPWLETDWDGPDPVGESYKQLCLILHRELMAYQEALNDSRVEVNKLTERVKYLQQELKTAKERV